MDRLDEYKLRVELKSKGRFTIIGHGYSGDSGWSLASLANRFLDVYENERKRFGGHIYQLTITPKAKRAMGNKGAKLLERIVRIENNITKSRFASKELFNQKR